MIPRAAWLVAWRLGDVGGLERHFCDLAIALQEAGSRVTVFVEQPLARDNRYAIALRGAGITVVAPSAATRLAMRIEHRRLYRRVTAWRRQSPATHALLRALDRQARAALPDIVHVHGCRLAQRHVLLWAKARGVPAAYTEHVTIADWDGPHDADSPPIFHDAAAAIACMSEPSRASLARYFSAPILLATHIVPDIAPSPLPSAGPLRLLAVGRLDRCKGHHVLLQAAARLREAALPFTLAIAGEGEERAALTDLRRSLDLDDVVHLLGEVPQQEIASHWAEADLAILPSLTESLPIALVEALCAGRAVVATHVGGIPELMSDGAEGWIVPAGDDAALAAAILRYRDRSLLARHAAAARRRYERDGWSTDRAVARTAELYALAARLRRDGPPPLTEGQWEADLAHRPPLSVTLCTHRLARFGQMEQAIVRQAVALAGAEHRVALVVDRPIGPGNRYRRELALAAGLDRATIADQLVEQYRLLLEAPAHGER